MGAGTQERDTIASRSFECTHPCLHLSPPPLSLFISTALPLSDNPCVTILVVNLLCVQGYDYNARPVTAASRATNLTVIRFIGLGGAERGAEWGAEWGAELSAEWDASGGAGNSVSAQLRSAFRRGNAERVAPLQMEGRVFGLVADRCTPSALALSLTLYP